MKRNYLWVLFVSMMFCLPNLVSAAPNLVGVWKGSVRKVTDAACPAPINVTLTLSQCLVGTAPGNLFKGTLQVGTTSVKIVGRINADNTFIIAGSEQSSALGFKSAELAGKFIPAAGATPAKFQVITFAFNPGGPTLPVNEMYDIFTLQK